VDNFHCQGPQVRLGPILRDLILRDPIPQDRTLQGLILQVLARPAIRHKYFHKP
jgi:hypothetical protein